MDFYKGVKVWKIGECDWVYAPTEKEAIEVMNKMCGEDDVKEIIEFGGIHELTQKEFDEGKINMSETGTVDCIDPELIPYRKCLDKDLKEGPVASHFATTEM